MLSAVLNAKREKKSYTWENKLCIIQNRTTETHLIRSIVLRADPQTMRNTTDWVWVCCFWILAHFGQTEMKNFNMKIVNTNFIHAFIKELTQWRQLINPPDLPLKHLVSVRVVLKETLLFRKDKSSIILIKGDNKDIIMLQEIYISNK